MAKKLLFFIFISLIVLFTVPKLQAVNAAYLKLDPTAINTTVGANLEVKVNASLGAEQSVGIDAVILYDKNLLQAQLVKYGTFFPQVTADITDEGKVKIYAYSSSITDAKSGEGTIGTIVFQTKKDGTGNLFFDCTAGSTTDSNIVKNDEAFTDIIQCDSNVKASLVISAAGQSPSPTITLVLSQPTVTPAAAPSPTITPTRVPAPTVTSIPTTTPSQLPRAGSMDQTFRFILWGMGLLSAGVIIRKALLYIL